MSPAIRPRPTLMLILATLALLAALALSPALAQDDDDPVVMDYYFIAATELDPAPLVAWMELLYRQVEAERVSAPAAARLYGYAGVAQYEALLGGMPDNRSLVGQIAHLPDDLPLWDEDLPYDWHSVLDATLGVVLPGLFYNPSEATPAAFADLLAAHTEARIAEVGEAVVETSQEYGRALGEALLAWIAEDGFLDTRAANAEYQLPVGEGLYTLTGDFPAPVEPYWGTLRPFVLDTAYDCHEYYDLSYNADPDSTFYKQAEEVARVERELTDWQQETARYWVDTPGETGTPAGHWWSIATQLIDQLDLRLDDAAMMYAMLGPALADAFISCWELKYTVLLPRPETFIREHINRRWLPYIQTPPFPEYPSGHSVVSAAAAEVLTGLFGTVAFDDETHVIYDHEPLRRSYTSFRAASDEAAISRLYGGIHFRAAIENGVRQGRCVGETVNRRLRLRPQLQGGE